VISFYFALISSLDVTNWTGNFSLVRQAEISTWALAPASVECETLFQFHPIPNLAAAVKFNM